MRVIVALALVASASSVSLPMGAAPMGELGVKGGDDEPHWVINMLMSAKENGEDVYKKVMFRHTLEAGPKNGEVVEPIPNTPRPEARRATSKSR